jgi:hypothetical protein
VTADLELCRSSTFEVSLSLAKPKLSVAVFNMVATTLAVIAKTKDNVSLRAQIKAISRRWRVCLALFANVRLPCSTGLTPIG